MKKLLLFVTFTAMLASLAEAQQVPDARVLPTPLSSSCVPDKRTRLPRSAACFWNIQQSFPARGC
jgi:hypothetical protein